MAWDLVTSADRAELLQLRQRPLIIIDWIVSLSNSLPDSSHKTEHEKGTKLAVYVHSIWQHAPPQVSQVPFYPRKETRGSLNGKHPLHNVASPQNCQKSSSRLTSVHATTPPSPSPSPSFSLSLSFFLSLYLISFLRFTLKPKSKLKNHSFKIKMTRQKQYWTQV